MNMTNVTFCVMPMYYEDASKGWTVVRAAEAPPPTPHLTPPRCLCLPWMWGEWLKYQAGSVWSVAGVCARDVRARVCILCQRASNRGALQGH